MSVLEHHLEHQLTVAGEFFWHRLRWQTVAQYLPRGRAFELVDVGAGTGVLGDFLLRDLPSANYRFIEPIDFLEAHLEQRFGVAANARTLGALRSADFVTLLDVLEHQEDDRAFLQDVVSEMRPYATLLVTVPASMRLWSEWDVSLGHFRRYDKKTLLHLLDGMPVAICELSYLFPEMLLPGLLRARMRAGSGPKGEFPKLSRPLNNLLYAIGRMTVRLRRFAPAGTSVFLAITRTNS